MPASGVFISHFNLDNLSRYLENDGGSPPVVCQAEKYGQVMPILLDSPADDRFDFAVVWCSPDQASPAFAQRLASRDANTAAALSEVDDFCSALLQYAGRIGSVFVPSWTCVREEPTSALRGMLADGGSARLLAQMNLRLAENLDAATNVYVLDVQRWMERAEGPPRDPKLWYLAKVPFTPEVFSAAAQEIRSCLAAVGGKARKIILLDLDDTLWGGIVGDVGWEQLRLGGHDPMGEAYVDFQRSLGALTRQGVLLGVVSKNEEATALAAIDRHQEMVLRRDDFAGWRINWDDKARNIVELAHELNLGLDSVVFIDDNPVERDRVRVALPEVMTPEWPADPMLFPQALARLGRFDKPSLTVEDGQRTGMYVTERRRTEISQRIGSMDEWLKSLQLRVDVEEVGNGNVRRALQLLNKTNQMNLATRRLTEAEFRDWLDRKDRKSWCFRVRDRLGDSGITGLLSVEQIGDATEVRDFLLSCRVMGRKVEETILHFAIAYARKTGTREVRLAYEPTERNQPCLDLLERTGMERTGEGTVFVWRTEDDFPLPEVVECSIKTSPAAQ